ncbi:MAG TPA: MgtC/SapB family protein [Kofleriaceae bacterium]|jgi:uncharacterized membrane protein (DUF4010 family)
MEAYETQLALGTALAVGLLIGLEREQSKQDGAGFAGVRTYPIFALIGALATMLAPVSIWLSVGALAGVVALVSISYVIEMRRGRASGVTTEASVIATFLLGALAVSHGVLEPVRDRLVLVAALGVAITFLLSSKTWIHALAERVSREDFFATVKFLIVAVIVLPLLPHTALGPFDAIDPFQLGLLTITLAGLSFLGYVAMRWLGPDRGMFASAALGGLVSSTAVTMSFAARARRDPNLAPTAAAAIGVAWTIMVIRIGVLVALVHPSLLSTLAVPLGALAVGCIAGILLVFRKAAGPQPTEERAFKNPFELGNAIQFALLFGGIAVATKAAKQYLGDRGVFLAAGLSGTTDVDATTLSTARLPDLTASTAAIAILIAAISNTLVKTGMAFGFGNAALGRRVLAITLVMFAAGAVGTLAWIGLG